MRWTCLLVILITAAGCSDRLETGYKPRPLGASGTERRGYYADPFSPEAREAAVKSGNELQPHRSTDRY